MPAACRRRRFQGRSRKRVSACSSRAAAAGSNACVETHTRAFLSLSLSLSKRERTRTRARNTKVQSRARIRGIAHPKSPIRVARGKIRPPCGSAADIQRGATALEKVELVEGLRDRVPGDDDAVVPAKRPPMIYAQRYTKIHPKIPLSELAGCARW